MRAVSRKRAAAAPQRHAAETELGREGTEGTCAICGQWTEVHGHEIVPRGVGGNPLAPDVLACNPCNSAVAASTIEESGGWKASRSTLRHEFAGDAIGFLCATCSQPDGGWRHR